MSFLKSIFYPLLKLATPLIITGVIQSATFFFDTIFLSQLGAEQLAAGALVGWLFCTFVVILLGTLSSINILVAGKHGAKNEKAISLIARDGLWLAVLLAFPAFILFWNMPQVFLLFGQSPPLVVLAKSYLHALVWGIGPYFISVSLLNVILGLGHARLLLRFYALSIVLNIFFSFSLILGKFGLPALGIAGAGWGMTISAGVTAGVLVIYIITNENYKHYLSHIFTPTPESYLMELLQVGLPLGLMYCVEVAFFFALSLLIGSFGTDVLAANQIALQYLGIVMSALFSIGNAITVRMGYFLGAKDILAAKYTGYAGISLACMLMLLVAISYLCFPTTLISIDFDTHNSNNAPVVNLAVKFFTISALFQLGEAIRVSLFCALRSFKDTLFPLLLSIISFWGLALPVGYLLASHFHFEAIGFWWGMIISTIFSIVLLIWRFKYKLQHYL